MECNGKVQEVNGVTTRTKFPSQAMIGVEAGLKEVPCSVIVGVWVGGPYGKDVVNVAPVVGELRKLSV